MKMLASCCVCETAKENALLLSPFTEKSQVISAQQETDAAKQLSVLRGSPAFLSIKDIRPSLSRADLGGTLNNRELLEIARVLQSAAAVKGYIAEASDAKTCIDHLFSALRSNKFLENKISSSLIGDDEVADSAALTELVGSHFLVPEDKDEAETYVSFCYIARTLKLKQSGYTSFTILPTTACNARCIYCYEQGMQYVTMKEETVAQTIEFIKKVRSPKEKVNFLWFGGEPLVGERIIDKICAGMPEADADFA